MFSLYVKYIAEGKHGGVSEEKRHPASICLDQFKSPRNIFNCLVRNRSHLFTPGCSAEPAQPVAAGHQASSLERLTCLSTKPPRSLC